jgi:hypothetical protein
LATRGERVNVFRIEMLLAQQGDALVIEYGDPAHLHHVLIDAGTPPSYVGVKQRLDLLDGGHPHLELLIVSHIDTDHIGGVLKLFDDSTFDVQIDDVWFNAWEHLPDRRTDKLGPVDGEILSTQLRERKMAWNQAFDAGAVCVPEDGPLPTRTLPGGLVLTLLSPGAPQLNALRKEWRNVLRAGGLDPCEPEGPAQAQRLAVAAARKGLRLDRLGAAPPDVGRLADQRFGPDRAVANGSSIVVLAEYEGKSALLGADAFPEVVAAGIGRLLSSRQMHKLSVDAFKVCHHGSKHNTSNDLLSLLNCPRYLYSTNGNIFGHPDVEAVARVLVKGGSNPTLHFNYSSGRNAVWADRVLMHAIGYESVFPAQDAQGLVVDP